MAKVTLEDGRVLNFNGNPTQIDIEEAIGLTSQPQQTRQAQQQTSGIEPQNILGQLFNVPGAAIRSAIQGTGFTQGAAQPSKIPTFTEISQKAPLQTATNLPLERFQLGLARDIAGFGADVATQPVDVLLALVGKVPGVDKGISLIAKTKVGQVIGRELTKPRAIRAPRFVRRFLRRAKTPSGKVLKTRIKETAEQRLESLARRKGVQLTKTQQDISKTTANAKEAIKINEQYSTQVFDKTRNTMVQNVKNLTNELQKSAETGSQTIQKDLPRFFKENSRGYGNVLDDISDDLIKNNEQILFGETDDIVQRTIQELDEALITEGRPRQLIEQLAEKYSPQFIGRQTKLPSAATGQPVPLASKLKAEDTLPFKEFVKDVRRVKKSLSAGAKSGATKFSEEDIAVSILNRNVGEWIKIRVPQFAELQEIYAPIIKTMKKSNIVFKPFKGDFETKTGTELLKRSALGKTEAGEEALLSALEEGTPFAKGIGQVRQPITAKGRELLEAKQSVKPILDELRKGELVRKANVDKNLAIRIDKLSKSKEFIEGTFAQKELMIKKQVQARLKQIGLREDEIANLTADRDKMRKLLVKLGLIAGAIAAFSGGTAAVRSGLTIAQ